MIKMRKNAQAVTEYLVLFTLIVAALTAMQLYFRRSINAVIKVAADEVGGQKEGTATEDHSYEWIERDNSEVITTSVGINTETKLGAASVRYGVDETTRQEGGITFGVTREK